MPEEAARAEVPTLEQAARLREARELLVAGLAALPCRQRDVLLAIYHDGKTPSTLSGILGVSLSRVYQIHAAALVRLRDFLGRLRVTSVAHVL